MEVDLDPLGDALSALVPVPGSAQRAQAPVDDSGELGFLDDVCLGGWHACLYLILLAVPASAARRFTARARFNVSLNSRAG